MPEPQKLKIRPYARLLTMLGEQLITNERIALIELIKNSYDADASWVKILFVDFGKDLSITTKSRIIIEDDGEGMTKTMIMKHWLNPATPEKKIRKEKKATTPKGRIIQGEKGIGRFAILKLGRKIKIITRAKNQSTEQVVDYDFSIYDDEFLTKKGKKKDLFIDDLMVSLEVRKPRYIKETPVTLGIKQVERLSHGTRIEISDLKGSWTETKIRNVHRDITRLESIFPKENRGVLNKEKQNSFNVWIYIGNKPKRYSEEYIEKLTFLLNERAVIRIENGVYDEKKKEFRFKINGRPKVLKLDNPNIRGLNVFRSHFGKNGHTINTECGSFEFSFFVFDFSSRVPAKYELDDEDKKIIRDHRIYLYRDGIRVYPYGEPNDDWLGIDIHRGVVSAAQFLSNDQVVGFVQITQKQNPKLKDKTNREGLIDEGNATGDFRTLLRTLLRYVREHDYKRYRSDLIQKSAQDIFRTEQIQKDLSELKEVVKDNKQALGVVLRIEKGYRTERRYLIQRAETTEELAGVGLSVETASHDIMAMMGKAMITIDELIKESMHDEVEREKLNNELQSLRGMLSFIEAQLKDIQLLFKSSKQRRKSIRIKQIIDMVERIYRRLLKKENIELSIQKIGSPLIAKTTDAVLLQLFINLFDNAIYWLQQINKREKRIEILLDGNNKHMIFSDNGPGVDKDDEPYIFEPFYSAKGEEGRGLGLYIARQLLERYDYSIELAELKSEKILSGANFIVNLIGEEN